MQVSATTPRRRAPALRHDRKVMDYDPLTRTLNRMHFCEHDDTFVIETVQDASPTLDLNKASMAQTDERAPWRDGIGEKVASIPTGVWEDLMRSGLAYDDKALRRWLDDRDQSVFRTRPGRLSR